MNCYERLRCVREDNDLTQTDIANLLKTTRQQVSKWETGVQMMGVDKYITLAKYYNISVDYLLGLIDTPRKLKQQKYPCSFYCYLYDELNEKRKDSFCRESFLFTFAKFLVQSRC